MTIDRLRLKGKVTAQGQGYGEGEACGMTRSAYVSVRLSKGRYTCYQLRYTINDKEIEYNRFRSGAQLTMSTSGLYR